jgi:glycosyltransferase involved in cell wall biosynthesis
MPQAKPNGEVIVRYPNPSHWKSCNIIEEGLSKSNTNATLWLQDGKAQIPPDCKKLIVSDHRWLRNSNLSQVSRLSGLRIEFYLYGDFTLRISEFISHMEAFQFHDVGLIVASDSQKRLVAAIFPEFENFLLVKPYPFDEKKFHFSQTKRETFRKKYGLGEEKIWGFAGRISRQKGVMELMKTFLDPKLQLAGKLILLGPVHAHPFWQFNQEEDNSLAGEFRKILSIAGDRILWIPEVPYEEMPDFYSAIDTYVSLSYFHDEDFNLTLSEALAAGREAIVSAWGGHWRESENSLVRLVAMDVSGDVARPDVNSFKEALSGSRNSLKRMISRPLTAEEIKIVRTNPHFLKRGDDHFNRELYFKIYSSYL